MKIVFPLLFGFLLITSAAAQELTPKQVEKVVGALSTYLDKSYPLPDISVQYVKMLKKNSQIYKAINSRGELAERLNDDLQQVHHDVHLYVGVIPEGGEVTKAFRPDVMKKNNYGFKSVELDNLTGTAYISIPYGFNCTQEGFEMAGHAMNMAAYSDYVIIDVRGNGGGAGGMGHFLASYFFEPGIEKFYLDGFQRGIKNLQEYTYGYVPGKRLTHAKLYILIDKNTASASEGFAFAMQKLKRASVVGETSAGAGIAGTFTDLGEGFEMFLPLKMIVAPHTNEGWEGTGVTPDIATGGNDALLVAKKIILADVAAKAEDEDIKKIMQWKLDDIIYVEAADSSIPNIKIYTSELPGSYTDRETIILKEDKLFWVVKSEGSTAEYEMKLLKEDIFVIEGLNKDEGMYSSRLYINRDIGRKIKSFTRKTLVENSYIDEREILFN